MNERIKELAEQAGFAVYGWNEKEFKKFAELIIEQCQLAFWSESCRVSDLAYLEYCSNCRKIQEHFKDSNATTTARP
jgi:hypothetical protein